MFYSDQERFLNTPDKKTDFEACQNFKFESLWEATFYKQKKIILHGFNISWRPKDRLF